MLTESVDVSPLDYAVDVVVDVDIVDNADDVVAAAAVVV